MAAQFPDAVEWVVLCCAGVCLEEKDLKEGLFVVSSVGEATSILLPQTPEKMRQTQCANRAVSSNPSSIASISMFRTCSSLADSFMTRPERTELFQAQCVMKLMEAHGVRKLSLIGNSCGGFVGYSMAAQFPDAMEWVVLCCTGVCLEEKDLKEGLFVVSSVDEATSILLPQTPEKMRQLVCFSFFNPPKTMPSCFFRDFINVTCTEYVEEKKQFLNALIKDRKLSDLPKITQPTLILWEDKDQIFPLELGHSFKRRICFSLLLRLGFQSSSRSIQTNYLNRQLDRFLSDPISDFESLLQSHAFIYTTGHSNNIFFAAKLISLYSSFNKPNFGTQIFESIHPKDTFLWNSIIKSYFSNGEYSQALELYGRMVFSDASLNHFTIPMAVAACAELRSIPRGKNIHGLTLKLGLFGGNSAAGSSFMFMYAKCGEMEDASLVFNEMPLRDVVAWTTLVIGYVQNDDCEKGLLHLKEMLMIGGDGVKPNWRTIEGGLQACGNLGALSEGRCLHCYALKTGIVSSQDVKSTLLCMYSKCGTNEEALLAFSEVADKDLISWTVIISAYAKRGNISECLDLFWEMQAADIEPDGIVISSMLAGFGNSMKIHEGKTFHGLIVRRSFAMGHMINHSLQSMYCKFGCVYIAERLFERVCQRDAESWNWMVFGYSRVELDSKCLELFREMQHLGLGSNFNSLVSVISSCSKLGAALLGRSVHCYVIKVQIDEDISIANSLVDMYGKFRNLNIARNIFCRTPRDIVTWNILISAYSHNGHSSEAVALFDMMISEDLKPNSTTLVTVLSACSHLGTLEHGERVHSYIKERGLECNLRLSTALVDMYAKCGQLAISREIFNSMPERDVISWNVMISGYGIHGDAKSALEIFHQMEELGVEPNGLTFLAVLLACTHAGLVGEGKYLFGRMRDYGVQPTLKHYACIVDLLGRSGNLCEAESIVLSMPIVPDGGVWGALLSACIIHNNVEMGERIAKRAIELDPENDGYYILISNMYNSIGKWEDAERVRGMMKSRGVRKRAGWSAM